MIKNQFYSILGRGDNYYSSFHHIYEVSFPLHEQRTPLQQERAFRDPHYHLLAVTNKAQVLSFISYWEFPTYIYIEHLAVNPDIRSKGYGSCTLSDFIQSVSKPVLLEIDPPVDEVSVKRLRFYEKLGFYTNSYTHFHPPYREGFAPHELVLLSYPSQLPETFYQRFSKDLTQTVMKEW